MLIGRSMDDLTQMMLELEQDKAWDPTWRLPTYPTHNNPHIYMALVNKALAQNGYDISARVDRFSLACISNKTGLVNRWPSGAGGQFSHDERLGLLYNTPTLVSVEELDLLFRYDNQGVGFQLNQFISRILYVTAYGYATKTGKCPLWLQLWFSGVVLQAAYSKDDGAKIHTHIWLMYERMSKFTICKKALVVWNGRKRPMRELFSKEPGGEWLAKWAKENA